jgi:hypothetical protein
MQIKVLRPQKPMFGFMGQAKPPSVDADLCLRLANEAYSQARHCWASDAKQFYLNAAKAYEMLAIMKLSLKRDEALMASSREKLAEP